MPVNFHRSSGTEPPIRVPAIGLDLFVRLPPAVSAGEFCFIETVNAPGKGPPLHRHKEAEIFRVIEGRYLYEVDGQRFHAEAGDVVSIPGGAAHAFVNVTDTPARQYILITPGLDAAAFFEGLAATMQAGLRDRALLNAFGAAWDVEFLGPPLSPDDLPVSQEAS
jgi:quercetin dioxygenase-like cupin family protein